MKVECEFGCFCEEPGGTLLADKAEPANLDRVIQEKLARAERYRAFFDPVKLPETD